MYCVKKAKLKSILQFLHKNKNLIYFSGNIDDIDKGQLSGDDESLKDQKELVECTINSSSLKEHNFYEIKVKDKNNIKLICNKGDIIEIDYVLHDFLIMTLIKS